MTPGYHRVRPSRPCDVWTYSTVDDAGDIRALVFAYDAPTPDCLFRDVPRYFVTASAAAAIAEARLSGVSTAPVETRVSAQYVATYGQPASVEPVHQLTVTGTAGVDDFGFQGKALLIVSDAALALLRSLGLVDAEVVPYDPAYAPPTPDALLKPRA
jgi:hypothetical protein